MKGIEMLLTQITPNFANKKTKKNYKKTRSTAI
jgi:hypothetical protein